MVEVYLALGSNLAAPLRQVKTALEHLAAIPHCHLVACSGLYGSQPMGPQTQPEYVNAVVKITTSLAPQDLLHTLQAIENAQGRVRNGERWGPRTLDIDILLYGQQHISTDTLIVPHYGMKQREFVLYPLAEISPLLSLPDGELLSELLTRCPLNGLIRLESPPELRLLHRQTGN